MSPVVTCDTAERGRWNFNCVLSEVSTPRTRALNAWRSVRTPAEGASVPFARRLRSRARRAPSAPPLRTRCSSRTQWPPVAGGFHRAQFRTLTKMRDVTSTVCSRGAWYRHCHMRTFRRGPACVLPPVGCVRRLHRPLPLCVEDTRPRGAFLTLAG